MDVAATVVATRRSAPRPVGSKLFVRANGAMEGSVSGGCVETDVYEACRALQQGASPRLVTYGISDDQAFSVGLPCGGEIDVFIRAYDATLYEQIGDRRAVVFTNLETGEQRLEFDDGAALLQSRVVGNEFIEVFGAPPRLLVFGAIDTAEELCRSAKALGWRTIIADARARFATRERVPSADELLVVWPDEALSHVHPDHATAVVVLTHDEKFDIPAIVGTLATDAFYVGLLGSRRTQAKRRDALLEAGVGEKALERVHGPLGLDIGAYTPAETAVSILSEILAVRAGRSGGPLRESTQRIHAEV
ncbi:MAG: XdhC family protein [Gaiellaceae bacterium]